MRSCRERLPSAVRAGGRQTDCRSYVRGGTFLVGSLLAAAVMLALWPAAAFAGLPGFPCWDNPAPVARLWQGEAAVPGTRVFDASDSFDRNGDEIQYHFSFGDGTATGWQPDAIVEHSYTETGHYCTRVWVMNSQGVISPTAIVSVDIADLGDCTSAADCDDGVACTDDTCVQRECVYTVNNARCADNGVFCDGDEVCDEVLGCISTGDPCAAGEFCKEATNTCAECQTAAQCGDAVGCETAACTSGECVYTDHDADTDGVCDDADPCPDDPADSCGGDPWPPACNPGLPLASFANFAVRDNPGTVGEPVEFAAEACESQILYYMWNFGDGTYANSRTPQHTYNAAGTYSVKLTVIGKAGQYVFATQAVTVVDAPALSLRLLIEDGGSMFSNGGVAVAGPVDAPTVWTVDALGTVWAVDVSEQVDVTTNLFPTGVPLDVDATDALVAVAATYGGIYLLNPVDMSYQAIDTYADFGGAYAYGVALTTVGADTYLYAGLATGGLRVFRVTPGRERVSAQIPGVGFARKVRVSDGVVYVTDDTLPGVHAFAVPGAGDPDPLEAQFLGSVRTMYVPGDVAVDGNLLATSAHPGGVELFNISALDPDQPLSVAQARLYSGTDGANGVLLTGPRMYVSRGSSVRTVNVANPASAFEVHSLSLPYTPRRLRLGEDGAIYASVSQALVAILEP